MHIHKFPSFGSFPWASKAALFAIAVLALGLGTSGPASAASRGDPRAKFQRTTSYVVRSGETVDHDLYVMAEFVTIDGTVQGNLVTLARQVIVNGTVTGNLDTVSAQTRIAGTVGGDLRALSGVVSISGKVQQDVLTATMFVNIGRNGQVGGDLMYAAPLARVQGSVAGAVLSAQDSSGPAAGPTVYALAIPGHGSSLAAAPSDQEASPAIDVTDVLGVLGQFLQRYVSIIAIGSLLLLLVSGSMRDAAVEASAHPMRSVGAGVLAVGALLCTAAAIAFLSVILMAAMLGGNLGFILTLVAGGIVTAGVAILSLTTGALLLFASYAVVSLVVGRLLLRSGGRSAADQTASEVSRQGTRPKLARAAEQPFIALLIGALLVAIFAALPGFAGYVVDIVVLLLGLGAAALAIRHRDALVAAQVSLAESSEPALLAPSGGGVVAPERIETAEAITQPR
jgi:cytoskeletal protein CcmA (bactofilin family)